MPGLGADECIPRGTEDAYVSGSAPARQYCTPTNGHKPWIEAFDCPLSSSWGVGAYPLSDVMALGSGWPWPALVHLTCQML